MYTHNVHASRVPKIHTPVHVHVPYISTLVSWDQLARNYFESLTCECSDDGRGRLRWHDTKPWERRAKVAKSESDVDDFATFSDDLIRIKISAAGEQVQWRDNLDATENPQTSPQQTTETPRAVISRWAVKRPLSCCWSGTVKRRVREVLSPEQRLGVVFALVVRRETDACHDRTHSCCRQKQTLPRHLHEHTQAPPSCLKVAPLHAQHIPHNWKR